MLFRLFLLLTVLPILELWLLVRVTHGTSLEFTLLLVIATGVLGASLARWQGWRTVQRIQEELARGQLPTDSVLDGVLILVAGIVLVTPGLLTDAAGFLLLTPFCRRAVGRWLGRRFKKHLLANRSAGRQSVAHWSVHSNDEIIDVRMVEEKKDDR